MGAQAWRCAAGVALFAVGLLLFNSGFFLTRVELPDKSSCDAVPRAGPRDGHAARGATPSSCWTEPLFKRAIVVVIDALRYDFAAWNSTVGGSGGGAARPFENKLTVVRDLLLHKPLNSLLVPFYADPPTTTMQRLKGMVTGGLPTFMEIKDDVASEGIEITEDNFIDLLINDGTRNITFMGDDTWTVLFPNQFNRAFPYPSFNVKDLHTVDEGVLDHLLPEMRRKDWSFLVAHFLGVDHCGHRFGPENDAMRAKLLQMNKAIDDVVREMDSGGFEDTVLLVFGDHGMTEDGNHGGATDREVGAALFVYSPKPILLGGSGESETAGESVRGAMQRELELLHPGQVGGHAAGDGWLLERRPAVQQIDLAPSLALMLGLPIPFGSLGSIVPELFFVAEAPSAGAAKDASAQAWVARYERLNDALQVNVGQVLRYLRTYGDRAGEQQGLSAARMAKLEDAVQTAFSRLAEQRKAFASGGLSAAEFAAEHQAAYVVAQETLREASELGRSLWTQFNLERMAAGFALVLAGVGVVAWSLAQAVRGARGTTLRQLRGQSALAAMVMLMQMLARFSNSYIVAEPQVTTFLSTTLALGALLGFARRRCGLRACLSCVLSAACSRTALALGPQQWFRGQEVLPGDGALLWFWVHCALPLMALVSLIVRRMRLKGTASLGLAALGAALAGLHWVLQASGASWGRLVVPRAVYALGLAGLGAAAWARAPWPDVVEEALVPLAGPLLLVWGPGSPLVALLLTTQAGVLAYQSRALGQAASWSALAASWSTMSMTYFFATGHESAFNKLHYASPFVGFDEFEYYRGGIMMGSNTFGVYILLALGITVLSGSDAGKFEFFAVAFLLGQACRALVMVAFVAAARRHLMVWAIFAPKYVFDSVTLLVVGAMSLLSLAAAKR